MRDVVASRSIIAYKSALSPKGMYVMVGGSMAAIFQAVLLGPWISLTGRKKLGLLIYKQNKDLVVMKELFEASKVVPVIDRRYPLSKLPKPLPSFEPQHPKR